MATIRYMIEDVDQAITFYTRHLGFTLEWNASPAFARVAQGDLHLLLSGPQSSGARPLPDGQRPSPEQIANWLLDQVAEAGCMDLVEVVAGRIQTIRIVANPEKLTHV